MRTESSGVAKVSSARGPMLGAALADPEIFKGAGL